jgi:lipopolysaccharide biosynthesis glycosyltransferase
MEIITLFSGDYAYGAGALLNSLATAGFNGRVHVGIAGEVDWHLRGPQIYIHELNPSPFWIGNRKAEFILDVAAEEFLFLDADTIVLSCELLTRISSIIRRKPVFCAEGILPSKDCRRDLWSQRANSTKLPIATDIYYNSGMLAGNAKRDRRILESWATLIESSLAPPGASYDDEVFVLPDQDCLNAVLQTAEFDFGAISPPDVWYAASPLNPFFHVGAWQKPSLLHCTGASKPWRIKSLPAGAPSVYDVEWFRFVNAADAWVDVRYQPSWLVADWFRRGKASRLLRRLRSQLRRFY